MGYSSMVPDIPAIHTTNATTAKARRSPTQPRYSRGSARGMAPPVRVRPLRPLVHLRAQTPRPRGGASGPAVHRTGDERVGAVLHAAPNLSFMALTQAAV